MRLRCFMKRIIKAIQDWYRGDNGEPEFNFVTQEYEYKRAPKRHWLAKLFARIFQTIGNVFVFFKNEWKILIPIFFTALNFIYTHSIDQSNKERNKEYKRCDIQAESNEVVTIQCLK